MILDLRRVHLTISARHHLASEMIFLSFRPPYKELGAHTYTEENCTRSKKQRPTHNSWNGRNYCRHKSRPLREIIFRKARPELSCETVRFYCGIIPDAHEVWLVSPEMSPGLRSGSIGDLFGLSADMLHVVYYVSCE